MRAGKYVLCGNLTHVNTRVVLVERLEACPPCMRYAVRVWFAWSLWPTPPRAPGKNTKNTASPCSRGVLYSQGGTALPRALPRVSTTVKSKTLKAKA